MSNVSFAVSKEDIRLIHQIALRAVKLAKQSGHDIDRTDLTMDLTACHANGCPLKLRELRVADDFDFAHDVWGIQRHIDRKTGKLQDCFLPRFAKPD